MLIKALIAFLTIPTLVAFVIPIAWLWQIGSAQFVQPLGLVPLVAGIGGLLWCVWDFYVKGRGTLAPMAPPQKLVINGLYCYSRNPMYVSVGLVLLGWAVSFNSAGLYLYTLLVVTAFHLFVIYYEEPWLKRKYGEDYERYVKQVPRWLW